MGDDPSRINSLSSMLGETNDIHITATVAHQTITSNQGVTMTNITSNSTSTTQDAIEDVEQLITMSSTRPPEETAHNSSVISHSFFDDQCVEVEPHHREISIEVPYQTNPTFFNSLQDDPVQLSTQVENANPPMDIELYSNTHPLIRESEAECILNQIQAQEQTVDYVEAAIQDELIPQGILHTADVHNIHNNNENEIPELPESGVVSPIAENLTEDDNTNEVHPFQTTSIVISVVNTEQVNTPENDLQVNVLPIAEQSARTSSESFEAADQTPIIAAMADNSQESIDIIARVPVHRLSLCRTHKRSISSDERHHLKNTHKPADIKRFRKSHS
ncbi:hypothetical protein I4U23_029630 [Adineta vaga]|nr:hypothetical protein I4U23_029630 [Adineta vaga]